jgi:hypothetical protein
MAPSFVLALAVSKGDFHAFLPLQYLGSYEPDLVPVAIAERRFAFHG